MSSIKFHVTIFSTTTLLMLAIYSVFVGVFFFSYGSYIEKTVVKNQIDVLINNFTEDFIFYANQSKNGADLINNIDKTIQNIVPPDLSKLDEEVYNKNSSLIKKATITLVITFIIFLILSIIIWYFGLTSLQKLNVSYWSIIQRLLLIMFIVMMVEFLFFTLVVGNYHPVDPNDIKKFMVKSLENYAKS